MKVCTAKIEKRKRDGEIGVYSTNSSLKFQVAFVMEFFFTTIRHVRI